jgi:hypothetical protein
VAYHQPGGRVLRLPAACQAIWLEERDRPNALRALAPPSLPPRPSRQAPRPARRSPAGAAGIGLRA